MPICHTESTETFHLSCWAVNESLHELQLMCSESAIATDFIKESIVESRKKELLVVRLLICQMGQDAALLDYNEDGKPFLKGTNQHISISHTHGMACVMLSNVEAVGVDIEKVSDRVEKIKHKFLKEEELQQRSTLKGDNYLLWLLLAWCTKEALYKYTARVYFDFKAHFTIDSINFEHNEIFATYTMNIIDATAVKLVWKRVENDYVMVYTLPSPIV